MAEREIDLSALAAQRDQFALFPARIDVARLIMQ